MSLTESIVEDAALTWFGELGYSCLGAEALTPALSHGERESYGEVVLVVRLREALRQLNPALPEEAREEALRKVLRVATPSLVQTNRALNLLLPKLLSGGVESGEGRTTKMKGFSLWLQTSRNRGLSSKMALLRKLYLPYIVNL